MDRADSSEAAGYHSHRFSTVRMADLIVVVANGRIVEAEPHPVLMRNRGF